MGEPLPSNEPVPPAVAGLRAILERAQRGNATELPELREAPRSRPDLVEYCGDLAATAERDWVDLVAGADLVLGESVKLRPAEMKASLAGPDPTPLERLAIERIAITWLLQCGFADAAATGPGDVPPRVAEFIIERMDRAQKRHLAALAMIRKLTPDLGAARDGEPRRAASPVGYPPATTGPEPSPIDAATRPLSIVSIDDRVPAAPGS
jgi:hypothetical protein